MGGAEIEILFFAGIAAFIGYRIYTVLGRRTGNERPPMDPISQRERLERKRPAAAKNEDNVVPLPRSRETVARPMPRDSVLNRIDVNSAVGQGLGAIRSADAGFDADGFYQGAKVAHEMIVKAFADGDSAALKPLLAEDVYSSFEGVVAARARNGHTVDFGFVGLKTADIEEASLNGSFAEVTVKFVSEMITATKDASGAVIEGAVGVVREVTDVWTFARDTRSSDPNWKVVATAGVA